MGGDQCQNYTVVPSLNWSVCYFYLGIAFSFGYSLFIWVWSFHLGIAFLFWYIVILFGRGYLIWA